MPFTMLLPPVSAVRLTWARTGQFPDDEHPKTSAAINESVLKDIKEKADKDNQERAYVYSAIAAMDACLRSLETIYKGRELNFQENEKLREAYLESVADNIGFGNKARDFLKSIPTMAISSAGGLTVLEALGITGIPLWATGLGLAGLGYVINLLIVRAMRYRKQMLYLRQDYERDLYYEQYVARVTETLTSLYLDLDRIHKNVFNELYPMNESATEVISGLLAGVGSTFCTYVHRHMMENKITPLLWPICESGAKEAVKNCPYWKK
jgi:hypothetical protein